MAFLDSLGEGIGSAIAGPIVSGLFGPQDRISHERFVENETRMDWHNQNNIGRESAFLAGVTPARADAYNTYQDATYASDTARQAGRIQTLGKELGMSPWELTGQQGAGAAPVMPGPSGSGNSAQNYMSSLVPLKQAEIQSKTALLTTAIQAQAQRDIAGQQTNDGAIGKATTANIEADTLIKAAQQMQTIAQTDLINTQQAAATNNMFLDAIRTIATLLPKQTLDFGIYKEEALENYSTLMRLVPEIPRMTGTSTDINDKLESTIKQLSASEYKELRNSAVALAGLISKATKGGLQAADDIGSIIQGGKNFLGGLTRKRPGTGLIKPNEADKIVIP